jgi:hypothetical protein
MPGEDGNVEGTWETDYRVGAAGATGHEYAARHQAEPSPDGHVVGQGTAGLIPALGPEPPSRLTRVGAWFTLLKRDCRPKFPKCAITYHTSHARGH